MNLTSLNTVHRHEVSYRFTISSHAGVDLGTCACGVEVMAIHTYARVVTVPRPVSKVEDLANRAQSLGYTAESAYRLADCFTNWNMITDPCMIHPNHSVTVDHQGYAVDGCEACKVLILSDDAGYTLEGWQATQAERVAEHDAYLVAELTQGQAQNVCVCWIFTERGAAKLSTGGDVCLGCGSIFTPEGTDASAEVLAMSDAVVARNRGAVESVPSATLRNVTGNHCPVVMADLMEEGLHISYGYGARDNGVMASWTPQEVTFTRADGSTYTLTFGELIKLLNDGQVSTYVPEQRSGVDLVRELTAISTPQVDRRAEVIKFHKLSKAMVAMIQMIGAATDATVDSWTMRNVILPSGREAGVTERTGKALDRRGILTTVVNPDSRPGQSMTLVTLTDRGREIFAALRPTSI